MVTTNIKNYSDEDIIVMINGVRNEEIAYTMDDLKKLLAESTNRKLDAKYTNAIVNIINREITGENGRKINEEEEAESSVKRPVTQKASADKNKEPVFSNIYSDDHEKFPVLSFLAGLYKVMAWLMLVVAIAAGSIVGYTYFKDEMLYIAASVFGGIMVGTVLLIFFYAISEKIQLNLEIERHLRK